jgi:hypothetical protein
MDSQQSSVFQNHNNVKFTKAMHDTFTADFKHQLCRINLIMIQVTMVN